MLDFDVATCDIERTSKFPDTGVHYEPGEPGEADEAAACRYVLYARGFTVN